MTDEDLQTRLDEVFPYLKRIIRGKEPNERHEVFNNTLHIFIMYINVATTIHDFFFVENWKSDVMIIINVICTV